MIPQVAIEILWPYCHRHFDPVDQVEVAYNCDPRWN